MRKVKDIHIKVTAEKHAKLSLYAKKNYRKMTGVIEEAIDEFLKRKKQLMQQSWDLESQQLKTTRVRVVLPGTALFYLRKRIIRPGGTGVFCEGGDR